MDATSVGKFLSSLKVPVWLLAAAYAISVFVVLSIHSLATGVSGSARFQLVLSAIFALALVILFAVHRLYTFLADRLRVRQINRARAFVSIYAPAYALFLTRHVTTATLSGAPRLSQRWENAKEAFAGARGIRRRSKRFCRALFDKRISEPSGEVEFGGDFPLDQINEIVRRNSILADEKLLELVRIANRAQYEDQPSPGALRDADIKLLEYIADQYVRCKKAHSAIPPELLA